MSATIPVCERCEADRTFARVTSVGRGEAIGVEWGCRRCNGFILDICPPGPLAPTRRSCLNCGRDYPDQSDFAACPACGVTRLGARDMFGLDPAPADSLARAEKFFEMGLIRRALATLNHALIVNPALEPAWRIKYAFFSGLKMDDAALATIEAATEHVVNPDLLISYAHLLHGAGRAREAADVYREYLATDPTGEYVALARQSLAKLC